MRLHIVLCHHAYIFDRLNKSSANDAIKSCIIEFEKLYVKTKKYSTELP